MLDVFVHMRHRIQVDYMACNEIVGCLTPVADEIQPLRNLAAQGVMDEFVLIQGNKHHSIEQFLDNREIQIKLYPFRLRGEKYYEYVEDLIKSSGQCYPSNRFYVHSLGFDSQNELSKPAIISQYESVTRLIAFLKTISDYQKDLELVFLYAETLLAMTTDYKLTDFGDLKNIPTLLKHMAESANPKASKTMLIQELMAMLSHIKDINHRFKYLLQHFDVFFLRYQTALEQIGLSFGK